MKNQNVRLPEQEEKKAVPKTKICQLRYAEQGTLKSRSRTGNLFQRESRKFSRNFPQFCRLPWAAWYIFSSLVLRWLPQAQRTHDSDNRSRYVRRRSSICRKHRPAQSRPFAKSSARASVPTRARRRKQADGVVEGTDT